MIHFGELTSMQVGELLAGERVPVLLLPVGAVEPHGPHAPLETDAIISAGMCERAARELAGDPAVRVLVLPPLPYGVTRYAADFPGAISIDEETLRALVNQVLGSLRGQGFERFVIVNNHFEPEHAAALRLAAQESGAAYLDLVRRRNADRLGEEFRTGSCHAGRYETSLVLADRPELVDTERAAGLKPVPVDMPAALSAGRTDYVAMGMTGAYSGAPAEATAEEGEERFAQLTAILVETIRELVD
jgi:creatinine amidohydrolase